MIGAIYIGHPFIITHYSAETGKGEKTGMIGM